MILAVATVRVRAESAAAYEAACAELLPAARAATPGVLFYDVGKCRDQPDTYRVVEAYADQAAMDAHIANGDLRVIIERVMACVDDLQVELHDGLSTSP